MLTGDCLKTATGDPKLGLARGETSSLLGLELPPPIFGRGLGWFLPARNFGLIPGDLSDSPGHLLSQFLLLIVSEDLGSISVDFAHK